MIAKAGLGLIGLGAISIGGVAVTKPHWLGMDYMPKYKVLSQEGNFNTTYGNDTNKFGNKYGKYLASSEKDNKSWWDWSFRRWEKNKPRSTSKFSSIDKGYESSGSAALNQICKAAYETSETEVKDDSEQNANDKFKKSEVWKYCSPVGQKPTTIKEFDNKEGKDPVYATVGTGGNNQIGKEKETELISVNDDNNQVFWDIRNQEFRGTNQTFDDTKHKFFKELKGKNKHIKDICAEAYKQTKASTETSSISQATTEETKKFCSLTITSD